MLLLTDGETAKEDELHYKEESHGRSSHNNTYGGSYTSGHFIWNLWNEPLASFKNLVRNDHECKILFIKSFFKNGFLQPSKWTNIEEENALLTRTLSMTLRVRAKVLLYVWSDDF